MTYIDYLKTFDLWLERESLPASSQLMLYKLLSIFNRTMWAEWIQVDNRRLMSLVGMKSPSAFIEARNKLINTGWIEYKKTKTNSPGKYKLGPAFYFDQNTDQNTDRNTDRNTCHNADRNHNKTKNKNNTKTVPPVMSPEGTESIQSRGFEDFWKEYPKKQGKLNARKAWDKLCRSERVDEMFLTVLMQGLRDRKESRDWQKDNGQYIPLPASWLNGRRWEDEVEKGGTYDAGKDIYSRSAEEWLRGSTPYPDDEDPWGIYSDPEQR